MRTLTKFFRLVFIATLIVTFNSCDKDDEDLISLSVSEKTLNFEDEYQIEATSNSVITYTVENEYNAEVSETGLVTARFVGETNILLENAEDNKTFKIIVEPKYNLYPEPDVEFGDTKNSIIAQFGSDYTETTSAIGYTDYSTAAPIIMFLFDDDDKLSSYALFVKTGYSSTLANFLIERYVVAGYDEDYYYFINGLSTESASMLVTMYLYNTSYWAVLYIPYTSSSKSAKIKNAHLGINTSEFDKLMEKL